MCKANSPLHCSIERSKGVFVKAKSNAEIVRVDNQLAVYLLRAKEDIKAGEEICWSYGFYPVTDRDFTFTFIRPLTKVIHHCALTFSCVLYG